VSPDAPDVLLPRIEAVVGSGNVVTDPAVAASYVVDWTGRFRGSTPAVVRPGTTAEVAEVVRLCDDARVAVVPQGGNTGLVGGSVPLAGEVVLSLRRLDELDPVDADAMKVTVGAGVTLGELHRHCRAAGLAYAIDLAARDSATIGGSVATNAGGVHVMRYGSTRHQLLGAEAVLANGSVLSHLRGLVKDNTGYDLPGLLCGSEGTLGLVTSVCVRLVPRPEHVVVALVALASVEAAVVTVGECRRRVGSLQAAELFFADGLGLVCDAFALDPPFGRAHPVYVVLEAADRVDPTDALAAAVAVTPTAEVAVATDESRRAQLWSYREEHTAAINTLGAPHKLDVTVPMHQMASFVHEVPAVVRAIEPASRTWLFGHLGDGNIHVNVTGVDPTDTRVDDAVLRFVARLGGSISAEHGIGTAKKLWLSLNRSPQEIDAFRRVKASLDPNGILNPNVLLP
jgi:FAD/FMN-containing dehydrogenase